jgi:hypothetical protein
MSHDTKAETPRVRSIPERLIFIGGLIIVAAFLGTPRLLDWIGPIATVAILGLLLIPAAILRLKSKRGTFQFRSAEANLSFVLGLFLVFIFFWLASLVPRNEPILLAILIFSLLLPGLLFGLAGAMVRLFLMAEGMGYLALRYGRQVVPHLTHKNFHRVLYFGYFVAGAGAYTIGVSLPAGVSPYIPWTVFAAGLMIIIVALTLDHEFASRSNR